MGKRVSLILGDEDEHAIAPFVQSGTEQFEVLRQWAARHGEPNVKSEASALRTLLQVAVEALRDDVLDSGYADLATVYGAPEPDLERRAARSRYTARAEPLFPESV